MCMEFWCGWFDHWGATTTSRATAEDAAAALREILERGASVNVYMAHGGTNFGGWAGANRAGELHDGPLQPTVTSYDYDAPIDERGRPTEKFWRFRDVLSATAASPPTCPPCPPCCLPPRYAPRIRCGCTRRWTPSRGRTPPRRCRRRSRTWGWTMAWSCTRRPFRDRAGRTRSPCATCATARTSSSTAASQASSTRDADPPVLLAAGHAALEILVESMGRPNFGPLLGERKGLLGGVLHQGQYVHGYTARPIPLEDISRLSFQPGTTSEPLSFFRTTLEVAEPADAFLALPGWGKGYVWINGVLLGRYWKQGPQQTLYVPAPLLETGVNEIIHLELDQVGSLLQIRAQPSNRVPS